MPVQFFVAIIESVPFTFPEDGSIIENEAAPTRSTVTLPSCQIVTHRDLQFEAFEFCPFGPRRRATVAVTVNKVILWLKWPGNDLELMVGEESPLCMKLRVCMTQDEVDAWFAASEDDDGDAPEYGVLHTLADLMND